MAHAHNHDHDHDHDHDHTPTITRDNERKVLLSFGLIATFMVVEVVGGLMSGSLALLADAGHMLTDAAALALAYAAFRFGQRAADARRTFGYLRFEVVAGLVNALLLFAIVGWIAYEAWERFQQPAPVLAGPMFGVAIAGLLVNVLVFWILTRGDSEHVNIKGAALHVMGDLLGSVGAVVAALVIYATGWTPIDPILSVLVSLLVLRSAWKLAAKSLHILLEGAPDGATPDMIERHLIERVPGIAKVSHVHVWSITSGRVLATLHVRPGNDADARAVVQAVERTLRADFEIEHATVAVDWNEGADSCSLAPDAPLSRDKAHSHEHGGHTHLAA
ncbi:cation diffusion facilitator family transporter [Qipengyuania flava]|uniref:Cation diffusion facilitator family transporter n=1 Tax=Qipengyuania flava TaxID=192812 RepID=A0A5P6N7V7_9SPHN|nr:cation diffusion facilitator family transporter [Qipengyuania flava]KZX52491.1 zinc transporter ZitB [Erythrobacter sp. HI00D59]MAB44037.1 cation transporter [Sphingomonadaceae bacterium]QFI62107.1 cation diffusion facilitator family transporter [Qipengyuania flava]|tara:strand:- start:945 stop:1943 length:999 start_codon:yes stop_codon:yes gene_type:complete